MASYDRSIPPGQEGKITLKSTARGGGLFSKRATVQSNDPKLPEVSIKISCTVKQYISVEPNPIKLYGLEGDKIRKKATITLVEGETLEIKDIIISTALKGKVKYELKTIEEGKKYSLEVENSLTEINKFGGYLKLVTNHPNKPFIKVSVNGRCMERLTIKPGGSRIINFRTINTASEIMVLSRTIVITDNKGDDLTIEEIKTSKDWIKTETKKDGKRNTRTIIITLNTDELSKGEFEEKLEIRTNYKEEYLTFKVKGKVI